MIKYITIQDGIQLDLSQFPIAQIEIVDDKVTKFKSIKSGIYLIPDMRGWSKERLNRWLAYRHNNKFPMLVHKELNNDEIK